VANGLRFGTKDGVALAWLSNDGQSWNSLGQIDLNPDEILTDGRHAIQIHLVDPADANGGAPAEAAISAIGDDCRLVTLTQSGEGPLGSAGADNVWTVRWALGPTGILASDGSRIWLGVPGA
jgi:hypothetical protein